MRKRRARDHKKNLPSSKRQPEDPINALVRSTLCYYKDWFKRVESRRDRPLRGVYRHFSRFAKEAREDLEILARLGIAPPVVVCLMFSRILMSIDPEWEKERATEWRKLSSYNYWKRGRSALQRADDFLSEFAGLPTVRHISEHLGSPDFDPFVKVCRKGIEVKAKLRELVDIIDELELPKPGWTLKFEPGGKPLYRKSAVAGRKKSGRERKEDWGLVAGMLHEYFMRSTGRPHWGAIPRLLHFAGFEGFPELILREGEHSDGDVDGMLDRWEYKNKVRVRVLKIREDPVATYTVGATVDDYEIMWRKSRPAWWIERFEE